MVIFCICRASRTKRDDNDDWHEDRHEGLNQEIKWAEDEPEPMKTPSRSATRYQQDRVEQHSEGSYDRYAPDTPAAAARTPAYPPNSGVGATSAYSPAPEPSRFQSPAVVTHAPIRASFFPPPTTRSQRSYRTNDGDAGLIQLAAPPAPNRNVTFRSPTPSVARTAPASVAGSQHSRGDTSAPSAVPTGYL